MTKAFSTPGVYIEEKNAFPNSVIQVATAIPAFVGYTEKALGDNKSLHNKPTRITSLSEFHECFGQSPKTTYTVAKDDQTGFKVKANTSTKFNLYNSMRLFFSNGGSTCYVVSVGHYDYKKGVNYSDLYDEEKESGIPTLLKYPEPTMLVIPDAVLLEDANQCSQLQKEMLKHCGKKMRNRIALLDVYNGDKTRICDEEDIIAKARDGFGMDFLQWGTCYYPYLNTTIVQNDEVDFTNISNLGVLISLLNTEADALDAEKAQIIKDEISKLDQENDPVNLHQALLATLPLYGAVLAEIKHDLNVLPPSGGMAGVISGVDAAVGVFKSPANVSLGSVVSPTINITSNDQEDLNSPLNGKAINAIRSFPGKGVLVWGARTLDGNSQDWKYLSVKRTVIMFEQSLIAATQAYVFEPNDVNTWDVVKGMITNFLNIQWKQGALAGAVPEDAFSVDVGLGSTMTPTDILDGKMNITVKLAISRPAEFIVITFQQQMQLS